MDLLRILLCGITALEEGKLPVNLEERRNQLLPVKYGEVSWEEVDRWRQRLYRQFELAHERTALPAHPDIDTANLLLIKMRRAGVDLL